MDLYDEFKSSDPKVHRVTKDKRSPFIKVSSINKTFYRTCDTFLYLNSSVPSLRGTQTEKITRMIPISVSEGYSS